MDETGPNTFCLIALLGKTNLVETGSIHDGQVRERLALEAAAPDALLYHRVLTRQHHKGTDATKAPGDSEWNNRNGMI